MRLYTYAEVMADICAFEGVTIKRNPNSSSLIERSHFLKMYSEQYARPMAGDATVEHLTERINNFFANQRIGILPFDRSPMDFADENDEDFVVIYREITDKDSGPRLEFLEATSDRKRMEHYMSRESNEVSIAVVFIHDEEVGYFRRNFN